MPIASGFSIQRNDIIDVPHRTQKEIHQAVSGANSYQLRSKPDFIDKTWNWDIRLGENRVYLDRKIGVNLIAGLGSNASETIAWEGNVYVEGSTTAGSGAVKYDSSVGEYGALIFADSSSPITGEVLEIKYVEAVEKFTGNDGGLLFQLAHDMCLHPYESPEIFRANFRVSTNFTLNETGSDAQNAITNGIQDSAVVTDSGGTLNNIYPNNLAVPFNFDYGSTTQAAIQRKGSKLYKLIREHTEVASVNMSGNVAGTGFAAIDPADPTTYVSLMNDFPLTTQDLGSGEFRVAINGRVLPRDDYVITSTFTAGSFANAVRTTEFKLKRNPSTDPMTWIPDLANASITITYVWQKSLDVPYGALVGPTGMSPEHVTTDDLSWPHTDNDAAIGSATKDYWVYSSPVQALPETTGINAFVGFKHGAGGEAEIITDQNATGSPISHASNSSTGGNLGARIQNLTKVSDGETWLLTFIDPASTTEAGDDENYIAPFDLVYPKPASSSQNDIKSALRRITDKFLVESNKGVDLLSDTNLSFINNLSPAGNRKPQKWRIRFEWDANDFSLKVHVATSFQLKDDMKITETQGRDGIKQPIFREPGELCDVYKAPSIGRGSLLKMNTAKSHWFRKVQTTDEVSQTYPMSYRMTITDHGIGLFVFDQGAVDQDDDHAWFVVQRHVNQTSGQPEYTEKSPVHCVYSPAKRPVDVSALSTYFASSEIDDLSKPSQIIGSLGGVFNTEAPTIYVDNSGSLFNGVVNAVDFNNFGYSSVVGPSTGAGATTIGDVRGDLYRGITGPQNSDTTDLWGEKAFTMQIDMSSTIPSELKPGMYLNDVKSAFTGDTKPMLGGRIKDVNLQSGRMVVVSHADLSTILANDTGNANPPPATTYTVQLGTSVNGDVTSSTGQGDFLPLTPNRTLTLVDAPGAGGNPALEFVDSVNDLQILGYNSLPRRRNSSIQMGASRSPSAFIRDTSSSPATLTHASLSGADMTATTSAAAPWISSLDIAPSFSRNTIFPAGVLDRISTFKDASASGTGVPPVPDPISINDYKTGDSVLLDILYTAQSENMDKVFESMIVALDDIEIKRDKGAVVLSYDEWVQRGDPSTVGRFLESLDAAGATILGTNFKLPAVAGGTLPTDILGVTVSSGAITIDSNVTNTVVGRPFFAELQGAAQSAKSYSITTSMMVQSELDDLLVNKLPGDIIWSPSQSGADFTKNEYCYDFMNKTLFFKYSPRAGSSFSISMVNYSTSNPAQNTYIISTPEDRNFPERNLDEVKTINRFIVREQDVLRPWDYHTSATMHEIDSHAIINPQEQLSITQDRNFVFSFPTQLTSQRFYYPQSELDLICISSADFSTQAGHVEINKYGDSDGLNGLFDATLQPSGLTTDEANRYAGHNGPDGEVYIWRKDARKYEGMSATLPNGNGMRIFMQVTGSSIRYSDVTTGKSPGSTSGT